MQKTELYSILVTFSKKEMVKFRKFLDSPYFAARKKLLQLFDGIAAYYPLFSDSALERKALAAKIYPESKYNDATMRNLLSDLHEQALNFLKIENFTSAKAGTLPFLLDELKKRDLNNEYARRVARTPKNGTEGVDWQYFLNNHLLELDKFNFARLTGKLRKQDSIDEEIAYLECSVNNLLCFLITNLASIYLTFLSYKSSYNTHSKGETVDSSIEILNFPRLREILGGSSLGFVAELYEALLKLHKGSNTENEYLAYKNVLYGNIGKLSSDERSFHFVNLLTYCTLKVLADSSDIFFNRELFDVYKDFFEHEYYLNKNTNHLPHDMFRNALGHALVMKEYGWALMFVDKFSSKLPPDDIENMTNFGYANLYYSLGELEKSMKFINRIELDYFVFKIDIKNLSLKIFYETGYDEEALSLIKTYKQSFRTNNMLNTERKKRYINFSKYVEQLILIRTGSSKQDIGFIKLKICQNESVAFKSWLLEKVAVIEKNYGKAV